MNFYHSSLLPFSRFALTSDSRSWELERNTRNTLNSRVSKWALKFLAVKPAAPGNSRAVNLGEGGLRGWPLREGERKEMLSRSLTGFKIHVDTLAVVFSFPARVGERNYLLLALMSVAVVGIAFITRTSFTTGPRSSYRPFSSSRAFYASSAACFPCPRRCKRCI